MKKTENLMITGAALVCALLLTLFTGCTGISPGTESQDRGDSSTAVLSDITKVELYHFHGNQQCYSCVLLGDLAEKVVKDNYPDEIASGKLVFGHIKCDKKQ